MNFWQSVRILNIAEIRTFKFFIWQHCSSCFSLVKVKLPVAGAAKFQVCVVIRFLPPEGQLTIGILSNWSLKIQNEIPPPTPLSMN